MTVLDLIKRSLRLLTIIGEGETPTAGQASDALSVFNSLVQDLGNENMLIFVQSVDVIPFLGNQYTTTVGPSGLFVTQRPVQVQSTSYIQVGTQSWPLQILTDQEYANLFLKTQVMGYVPTAIYLEMNEPNMTVTLWPPSSQAFNLILQSNKRLATFTSLTDVILMPDGYERMLAYNLALDLADEYGVSPSGAIVKNAATSKKKLKRTNAQIPVLENDIPAGNNWGWGAAGMFPYP